MAQSSAARQLVIHAGTHKTATSYIQSRLAANQSQLARCGIAYRYPASSALKFKPLVHALARGQWRPWRRYLAALPPDATTVLMSAEQFTQPLARPDCHGSLLELLARVGFGLRVVVFLRDQPDYINARFVHSTRRLYHHQSFEAYVAEQLGPKGRPIFDYHHLFASLLDRAEGRSDLDCVFLPYGSALGDPFERLMASQGWQPPTRGWRRADPRRGNVQPGCGGVWLAQAIGARLTELGVKATALHTGSVVRRIAERQGWTEDRYCGFDADSAARVAGHFASTNDAFARRVWDCSWRERVPVVPMQRRQFTPPSDPADRRKLDRLVDKAIVELARQNPPLVQVLASASAHTMAAS
ncbi:MAG: hypothetical protein R6U00_08525 [Prochlorococcaceae cyanobacterium]